MKFIEIIDRYGTRHYFNLQNIIGIGEDSIFLLTGNPEPFRFYTKHSYEELKGMIDEALRNG